MNCRIHQNEILVLNVPTTPTSWMLKTSSQHSHDSSESLKTLTVMFLSRSAVDFVGRGKVADPPVIRGGGRGGGGGGIAPVGSGGGGGGG